MSRPLASPKPLTGRKVLFMLVAFFGVVIAVNVIMAKLAIQTLPGTEVDSAYSASLAYESEIAAAHDQNARNWKVDAHIERDSGGGATLQVEARDKNGPPMSGLKFQGRFERPTDRRADQAVALAEVGKRHLSRECAGDRARTMGSGARRRGRGTADVPVQESGFAELGRNAHAGDTRLFALCEGSGFGPLPHGSCCRGRQLRRMHVEDRARAFGDTRRDARARQSDRPPRGAGMEAGRRSILPDFIDRLAELGYKAYPFETVRAEAVEAENSRFLLRCLGVAAFATMNVMMLSIPVWSGWRHDSGTARFFSLAVGADRAAGRGLCRPAVLPLGVPGAAHAQRQYGCSDQHRRHACARNVGGRNPAPRRAYLFRCGHHAADLPAGGALSRPEHAPENARGRGKPGGAQGRDRDQVRRARRDLRGAGGRDPAWRYRSVAAGRTMRGRRRCDRRTIRDRPEPDHRARPCMPPRSMAPLSMPARSTSPARCGFGFLRHRKARCWRKSPGCSTTRCRRAPAMCNWRIGRPGSMRRWCMPPHC